MRWLNVALGPGSVRRGTLLRSRARSFFHVDDGAPSTNGMPEHMMAPSDADATSLARLTCNHLALAPTAGTGVWHAQAGVVVGGAGAGRAAHCPPMQASKNGV
jgi:hypothetical protein